jgi:hypothetical protein
VALTWVGDGSTKTAAFHEGVNFAAVQRLPAIFIIQNNQVALGTRLEPARRRPFRRMAEDVRRRRRRLRRQPRARRLRGHGWRWSARAPARASPAGRGDLPDGRPRHARRARGARTFPRPSSSGVGAARPDRAVRGVAGGGGGRARAAAGDRAAGAGRGGRAAEEALASREARCPGRRPPRRAWYAGAEERRPGLRAANEGRRGLPRTLTGPSMHGLSRHRARGAPEAQSFPRGSAPT